MTQSILVQIISIIFEKNYRNYLISAREAPTLQLTKAVSWTPSTPEVVDGFVLGGGHFILQKTGRITFTEAIQPSFCRLSPCLLSMWL